MEIKILNVPICFQSVFQTLILSQIVPAYDKNGYILRNLVLFNWNNLKYELDCSREDYSSP